MGFYPNVVAMCANFSDYCGDPCHSLETALDEYVYPVEIALWTIAAVVTTAKVAHLTASFWNYCREKESQSAVLEINELLVRSRRPAKQSSLNRAVAVIDSTVTSTGVVALSSGIALGLHCLRSEVNSDNCTTLSNECTQICEQFLWGIIKNIIPVTAP